MQEKTPTVFVENKPWKSSIDPVGKTLNLRAGSEGEMMIDAPVTGNDKWKVQFNSNISLGNLLTLAGLLLALVVGYVKLEDRVSRIEYASSLHQTAEREDTTKLLELDEKVTAIKLSLSAFPPHKHIKGYTVYPGIDGDRWSEDAKVAKSSRRLND